MHVQHQEGTPETIPKHPIDGDETYISKKLKK